MVRRRALLVGGSYSAIPIGKAIRELGLEIICLTGDSSEPMVALADEVVIADYSQVADSLTAIVDKSFDYVVPSCNDAAYTLCAQIAEMRQLPGYDTKETVEIVNSKILFRDFCNRNSLPSPKQFHELDLIEDKQYPVIVKPNRSFSGRGVSVVRAKSELSSAIDFAKNQSIDDACNVEQYVNGNLHSISAFLVEGKIESHFFVDEFCVTYPYQVDKSNHPSRLKEDLKTKAYEELHRMALLLKLVDGLVHLQFIVSEENVYFIECMRRCPGDLYGNLIEYSTQHQYYLRYVNAFLGNNSYRIESKSAPVLPVARFTESFSEERIFESYEFSGNVMKFFPLVQSGDKVSAAPYGKSGIGFIRYESTMQLFSDTMQYGHESKVNIYSIKWDGHE